MDDDSGDLTLEYQRSSASAVLYQGLHIGYWPCWKCECV